MATMTVWHKKLGGPAWGEDDTPFNKENFELVAALEQGDDLYEDLDFCFRKTQNIDHPWWDDPEVKMLVDRECRSTSVGDVIYRAGEAWRCCSVGWKPVDAEGVS